MKESSGSGFNPIPSFIEEAHQYLTSENNMLNNSVDFTTPKH